MLRNWLTNLLRRKPQASPLPLGLSETEVQALKQLAGSPHWKHYLRALEATCERQVAELASGLPHDRYLFTCGALYALRRLYTLTDDVLAVTQTIKETADARQRASAERQGRASNVFLNTPWYDQYVRDRVDAERASRS
jgi:hypothetical protein